MLKTKLFLLALVALCSAATVSADVVWSSAFDFDGTPTSVPVEIDVTTPIVYSSYLRDNLRQSDAKAVTITATAQSDPTCVANIFYSTVASPNELTGSAVWNFKDAEYDRFPKNDTYTLKEVIDAVDYDDQTFETTLTRTITLAPEPSLIIALGLIGALLIRRRIKVFLLVLILATIGSFNALAGGTVTSVTCQQCWPISRKVLITVSFTADSMCYANFYGTTDDGATTFNLRDRGTVIGMTTFFWSGETTLVWEPDSTLDSVKGKIKIGVELYDPDDVSDGSSTTRDQYRYMSLIPSGEWNDTYEKIKMALKLIPAETSAKGNSSEEEAKAVDHETKPQVTLRKSFIGDKKC